MECIASEAIGTQAAVAIVPPAPPKAVSVWLEAARPIGRNQVRLLLKGQLHESDVAYLDVAADDLTSADRLQAVLCSAAGQRVALLFDDTIASRHVSQAFIEGARYDATEWPWLEAVI